MGPTNETVSLVGVCGGAGTTRLVVELGATLARAGRSVAVVDADLATQGLADYVPGRIDPDVTRVLVDDAPLQDALATLPLDAAGEVAVWPAHAPFERLARAQTAGAAQSLGDAIDALGRTHDHVLVDVPPVATNLAIAAVTETDAVALVAPASERGANALQRVRGRLADVGREADVVIGTRGSGLGDADHHVPEADHRDPTRTPAVLDPDDAFAPAVATVAESLVGVSLGLEFPESGLVERLAQR